MSDPKQFVVLAVLFAACLFGVAQGDIKATAILFRHGQRTPVASSPNLNNSLTEELGEGQLTNVRDE